MKIRVSYRSNSEKFGTIVEFKTTTIYDNSEFPTTVFRQDVVLAIVVWDSGEITTEELDNIVSFGL